MDFNSRNDLQRLEDQIFSYNRNIKSSEQKANVSNHLRQQLLESKAVVRIKRMDTECESLMISLKQRLILLQDILVPKGKDVQKNHKVPKVKDEVKLNLSSDSSGDESLSTLRSKQRKVEKLNLKMHQNVKDEALEINQTGTSEPIELELPLALRRHPRERKLSYKSYSSTSTAHSKVNRVKLNNKDEQTVSTSGVTYHEEMLVEHEEVDETPTLHIKIPSLHRGNVHYIILDSVNFARKVFDNRANEIKQQQQQKCVSHSSKTAKSHQKHLNSFIAPALEQLAQQEQDMELSQLIEDVMTEACADETLQATNALENINKNLIDNYDPVASDDFITFSQSSQEFTCIQNSNAQIETVGSTSESINLRKKSRKNTKRSNVQQTNEPPKKRGRKPKRKIDPDSAELQQPQPPTKSNLAKYVELFSNDCELLPGSSTPAASSTRSLPLVSSTTHNFEVVDQLQQQVEQQSAQQPITYYIDGDWANGGPCQLVPTNSVSADDRPINQDRNAPFQDFVNYIDNSANSGSNNIARDFECSNSLPISIPLSIANLGLQNKDHHQATRQTEQSIVQNSLVPIINIQIPSLPNIIVNSSGPPPAHTHEDVLDLSIKSNTNLNISAEAFDLNQKSNHDFESFRHSKDEDFLPLDLSAKCVYAKDSISENNCLTIDTQDEDFIRRLIEQSDFNYSSRELKKDDIRESLSYDHDNNKSFKAALDMPLLDFDTTHLTQLAKPISAIINNQQIILADKSVCNDSTSNEDSNYVSMTVVNSSIENNLHISDQSTTEIFHKLLNVCPDNQFLNNMTNDFTSNDDLNESVFSKCSVENSTMCEVDNPTSQKNDSAEGTQKGFNTGSEKHNQDIGNTSIDEISSSIQLDSSNMSNKCDIPVNLKFLDDNPNYLKDANLAQMNMEKSTVVEICNDGQQSLTKDKIEQFIETTLNSSTNYQYTSDITKCNKELIDISEKLLLNGLTKDKENAIKTNNKIYVEVNDKYVNNSATTYLKEGAIHKPDEKNSNVAENTNISIVTNKNDTLLPKENYFKCSRLDNSEFMTELSQFKPKENIVFSVAKINLSEDDNLYITDSDSSSGKSCDLSEGKIINDHINRKNSSCSYNITSHKSDVEKLPKGHDIDHTSSAHTLPNRTNFIDKTLFPANSNEDSHCIVEQNVKEAAIIATNSTENLCAEKPNLSLSSKEHKEVDKECLYFYKSEEAIVQNAGNYVKEDDINVSKNLECTKATTVSSDIKDSCDPKDSNVINENLTLLELESKLNASLDFDEDLDDALSLATSCFNSPIDERFEDFIVDDVNATITTNTLQNFQNPAETDFKNFKIPKMNNSKSSSSEIMANIPEVIKFPDHMPTNSLPNIQIALAANVDKITRTVKNELAAKNETTMLEKIIFKVFGITCLPYLVDKCYAIKHCQLSHQLSSIDEVYKNLNTLDKIEENVAYQVLYNHSKLFKVYFEVFCTYYSTKNDRLKLLNMVNDCERYPEYAEFIIVIYESLVKCGLNRVNACRLLLKRIREKTIATSIVEALVTIIMKSDWTMFTDFIEKYTEDMYKFNFRINILELMAPAVLNSKGPHLKQVFGKCVQTIQCDDTGLLLNSPILIQCVALLTTNT